MTHRDALSALATAALLVTACGPKEPPAPPPSATPTAEQAVDEAAAEAVACNYIVLIDAGSTGSRAYTFQIDAAEGGGIPTLTQLSSAKVEPGLSSFKGEPDKAAGSIAGLLTQADSALDKLPDECEGKTPAALMATAGMRLLEGEDGGDAAAKAIYAAVTDAVRDTGLDLRFAGTISGQQEGLYTWITANYALGNLQSGGATVGALDLGGASAQIAFAPEGGAGASATLKFGDATFPVYAHSYLGYGLEQAIKYVADDACFPKGLNKGKGKFATCVQKLEPVVKAESCAGDSCGLAQPGDTKRAGVPQPKIPAEMGFYASTNFAYTYDFLKPEAATPAALAEAAGGPKGKAGFCGTKWKDIQAANSDQSPEHLENYCFSAGWITVLLDNLGFADDSAQITWSNQVGDYEAGWALGAALCS
ncbi:MAG: hypothetical protein KC486_16985, partial [Myxococcales bacterium]|nr:hypothetical protein [Myxococcales bacterium]